MTSDREPRRLTVDEALLVREAEARIARRAVEVEEAHAIGRLGELTRGLPSVEHQFEAFRSVSG